MKGGDCKALTEEIEKALGEVRAPLAGAQLSFQGQTSNLSEIVKYREHPDRKVRHAADQVRGCTARREELTLHRERLRVGLALPRQAAALEVHQHVADGFQVVATRLLDTQVRVDRRVTGGT